MKTIAIRKASVSTGEMLTTRRFRDSWERIPLWIVTVNGHRVDSFLYEENAIRKAAQLQEKES